MFTLIKKELRQFLVSPSIYVVAVIFFIAIGIIFSQQFFVENIASLRKMFEAFPLVLIIIIPAITMGTWAEERKTGTFELLQTMPIHTLSLLLAKLVSNFLLVAILLLLTMPAVITVEVLGQPDRGVILGGYLGLLFLSLAYISIGQFVSINSKNQVASFITSVAIICALFFIGEDIFLRYVSSSFRGYFEVFGLGAHYRSVLKGVIDMRDILYYLSVITIFFTGIYFSFKKITKEG